MTNSAHIVETALLVLAAYLLGCALGYCAHRILHAARGTRKVPTAVPAVTMAQPTQPGRPRTPAARLAAAASHDEPPAPILTTSGLPKVTALEKLAPKTRSKLAGSRPAPLSAPRDGQADDLKQIKGIGPKIEASLNALGIFHVDQIAAWTGANIDWVEGHLAFKGRIRRERWVEQAAELSKVKA